jgi:F-type H+-transporting ATPase subunit alpha
LNFSFNNNNYNENLEIENEIETFENDLYWETHGHTLSLGDGIIFVFGLYSVTAGEMVIFPRTNTVGLALNLTTDYVGVLPFADEQYITEGDVVVRLNKLMSVPVGDMLLGRVLDPLGNPIDVKDL